MPNTDAGQKLEDSIEEMIQKREYEYVNQEDFFRTSLGGNDQRFYNKAVRDWW